MGAAKLDPAHLGSTLDELLTEDGTLQEVNDETQRRVEAFAESRAAAVRDPPPASPPSWLETPAGQIAAYVWTALWILAGVWLLAGWRLPLEGRP
ncbi:MAG: hypothetical protein U1A78_32060 [Polyangia bacterium]